MTATNQAFIRAYRQDPPSPTPTAPAAIGQPAGADELGRSIEYVSAGAAYAESTFVTALPIAELARIQPGPAMGRESFSTTEHHPSHRLPVERDSRPSSSAEPLRRPLSSFHQPDAPPARLPLDTSDAAGQRRIVGRWRPAEIDVGAIVSGFRWPRVCRAIGEQCAGPLDRLADVLESRSKDARPLVGVASLHAGEGATTALLCLASRLAARGRRTIIVEGNFAAPSLAQRLGAQPRAWWQDVLERGIPVGDAVVRAADDRLDLLPLDARSADASQLASGLQASVTAGVLRYAYELALVDLGAILAPRSQPPALELVSNMRIESALVVTRPSADPASVAAAAHLLEENGCELLGTIENRVPS